MSEPFNTSNQMDNDAEQSGQVKLDERNVQEILISKRINGMSWPKKVALIAGILLVLTVAGYFTYKYFGSSQNTDYSTATISKAAVTDSIEGTGTLSPVKKSDMGFKNDDTIIALNVQPGDHVKQGQILAQQDPVSLQSTLRQALSSVEQDQISVQTTTLNYETNRKTLERQQKLFDAGAVSQTDLDTAVDSCTKSKLEVATAKSKLANDQIKVEQARDDLENCTLVAPFDGIIGVVNGQVGQINGINSSSSTLLSIMSDELELSALINEADIGRVKVGQDVEFTSSSFTDKTFKGKVLRITPQASTVSNVQYYPVLISCVDPERVLLSGMSVSVNVIVARRQDVLTVPMMAVSYAQSYIKTNSTSVKNQNPQSLETKTDTQKSISSSEPSAAVPNKKNVVLVMQNGQPAARTVVLGLNDGSNYELIEGLNEGDKVIVGSNQADTTSSSSGSTKSTKTQNQGGQGMGGPPPGF